MTRQQYLDAIVPGESPSESSLSHPLPAYPVPSIVLPLLCRRLSVRRLPLFLVYGGASNYCCLPQAPFLTHRFTVPMCHLLGVPSYLLCFTWAPSIQKRILPWPALDPHALPLCLHTKLLLATSSCSCPCCSCPCTCAHARALRLHLAGAASLEEPPQEMDFGGNVGLIDLGQPSSYASRRAMEEAARSRGRARALAAPAPGAAARRGAGGAGAWARRRAGGCSWLLPCLWLWACGWVLGQRGAGKAFARVPGSRLRACPCARLQLERNLGRAGGMLPGPTAPAAKACKLGREVGARAARAASLPPAGSPVLACIAVHDCGSREQGSNEAEGQQCRGG
jgi:hypothetical protein